ncbi:MAG: M24 family metallopeptidase, partial [Desulfovibrionaceae bacterium]|nr:M24 family metallopeptidase [Desulfovibrionaceae bacterium]
LYWSGAASTIPDVVRRAQDAALEMQQRAAEALKVGAIPSVIWKDACERARQLGVAEGFMGLGGNKVTFLGHGIGLVIDEYPVLANRFDEPLEEGMVIAIEPKIGLSGIGMVGVENTFEVTERGGRCITGTRHDMLCIE